MKQRGRCVEGADGEIYVDGESRSRAVKEMDRRTASIPESLRPPDFSALFETTRGLLASSTPLPIDCYYDLLACFEHTLAAWFHERAEVEASWAGSDEPPPVDVVVLDSRTSALVCSARAEILDSFSADPIDDLRALTTLLSRGPAFRLILRSLVSGQGMLDPEDGKVLADYVRRSAFFFGFEPPKSCLLDQAITLYASPAPLTLVEFLKMHAVVEQTLCRQTLVLAESILREEPDGTWSKRAAVHACTSAACEFLEDFLEDLYRDSFDESFEEEQRLFN